MCKFTVPTLLIFLCFIQNIHAQCVGGALAGSSFDGGNPNGWTAYDVAGDDSWSFAFDNASMNGFGGSTDEDWLISPKLDLSNAINPVFNFMYRDRFAGPNLQVVYSTNYSGSGDPNAATWTVLGVLTDQSDNSSIPDYAFEEYDLSSITSNCVHVAFLYAASGSGSGQAEDWRIDNICISAEDPSYYSGIQSAIVGGASCKPLKTQLHNLIKGHNEIAYTSSDTYDVLDFFCNYETQASELGSSKPVLWDMYSDDPTATDAYEYDCANDLSTTTATSEGQGYNREHCFPTSWWGGSTAQTQYTDVHHLFPSDAYVNGQKSNYPLGEVGSPTFTSFNGSKRGPSINAASGCPSTVFEPIDEYKGDFARAYLYMAVRYEDVITGWEGLNGRGDQALSGDCYTVYEPCMLELLLDWHANDPVSAKEIARNEDAFRVQGNRNPFIDHPEYADYIWGTTTGVACNAATPRFFAPKVFLQGPLSGLLMNDDLNNASLLPNTEPYTALGFAGLQNTGAMLTSAATGGSGNDAIVDWVLVELRTGSSSSAATTVAHSRAALLQRDGDVVDVDGVSPVGFLNVNAGNYYLAIRHRNHLGVMTNTPFTLN